MAVLQGPDPGAVYPLTSKTTLIGRDPGCDIVLECQGVSRWHAVVYQINNGYYIHDLGSMHGTRVSGQPVSVRTRVQPGDQVEIADLVLTFADDPTPEPPSLSRSGTLPKMREAVDADTSFSANADSSEARINESSIVSMLDPTQPKYEVAPEAKLRAVLEITQRLSNTLNLSEVLPRILDSLFTIFPQADRGFILLKDPASGRFVPRASKMRSGDAQSTKFSRTVVNYAVDRRQAILSADAESDERFDASQSIVQLGLRSIMCAPMLGRTGETLGAIQIDTKEIRHLFRQEDLDVLVCASTLAARAVDLANLHSELRDLETATQIQRGFLPRVRPDMPGLRFFDHYQAAQHVGGDYFDYIPLPGGKLAVTIGDVCGKGIPAALLMARVSVAARFYLASEPGPAAGLHRLNGIFPPGSEERFVTFSAVVVDPAAGTLTLASAGHHPPLLRSHRTGRVEPLAEEIIGMPLAVFDDVYREAVVPFEPGDLLVLFTDGVPEARNARKEFFSIERLHEIVAHGPSDAEGVGIAVLDAVQQFTAGWPQSDDLTLVCLRRD